MGSKFVHPLIWKLKYFSLGSLFWFGGGALSISDMKWPPGRVSDPVLETAAKVVLQHAIQTSTTRRLDLGLWAVETDGIAIGRPQMGSPAQELNHPCFCSSSKIAIRCYSSNIERNRSSRRADFAAVMNSFGRQS
jgi:hypothetical protein